MHKFVRGVITEWRRLRLPLSNATVVASISGGADSAALFSAVSELLRLKKLELRVVAAHYNHRLRGVEADADEDFVKRLTAEAQLELAIGHSHGAAKENIEENARIERYRFLLETAETVGASFVLTAHTKNDQAETFLLNLIRGSGPDGLAAMSAVRELDGPSEDVADEAAVADQTAVETAPWLPFALKPRVFLARPLLSWAKRADTEEYCGQAGIAYRYDSMNEDLNFTRVRVRKLLIPALEEFNPKIVDTLYNTSRLMRHAVEAETTHRAAEVADHVPLNDDALVLNELKDLSQQELYSKLRGWLGSKRGNLRRLELKHIESIERLVNTRKSGRVVELPDGGRVVKRKGRLEFENLRVEKSPSPH